jgi:hypothetical protein
MPSVGFKPTIIVYKRTKIFRASGRAATLIGSIKLLDIIISILLSQFRATVDGVWNGE